MTVSEPGPTESTMDWRGPDWEISASNLGVQIKTGNCAHTVIARQCLEIRIRRSWFRWRLLLSTGEQIRLRRLNGASARAMTAEIERIAVESHIEAAEEWSDKVGSVLARHTEEGRWIPLETIEQLIAERPATDVESRLSELGIWPKLGESSRSALMRLDLDIASEIAIRNEETMRRELEKRSRFFANVERSPLTEEQARAVICFDNRVQLVAAAGSGKTSVMIARAAYAVARGFVAPERILLLAYNRDAARELQERVTERFAAVGVPSEGVRAQTLHAFGYDAIGQATGRRPSLASWLSVNPQAGTRRHLHKIVEDLKSSDPAFRTSWEFYRLLLGRFPRPAEALESEAHDARDGSGRGTYQTYQGDLVRSMGEQKIADWLWLNGIEYEYERDYPIDTRTSTRRQYKPDFHYPKIEAWHEHWALGRNGAPPDKPGWEHYSEDMAWKMRLHAKHGSDLIQTTHHEVLMSETGTDKLAAELIKRGLQPELQLERVTTSKQAILALKDKDILDVFASFLVHVKSGQMTRPQMDVRLVDYAERLGLDRAKAFLDIFWRVFERWEADLATEEAVDFEDMTLRAAELFESGAADHPFDLILVDELQDSSRSRARLIRALLNRPGQFLLGVGDDWQSIYRFSGSDMSVMTRFHEWFGTGPRLILTNTFRCTQTICDIAADFIQRNPEQLRKTMRSAVDPAGPSLHIQGVPPHERVSGNEPSDRRIARAVGKALDDLSDLVHRKEIAPTRGARVTVDILGRYNFESQLLPAQLPGNLQVTFRTIHSAKGLEADCIIIPRAIADTYGLPSLIEDDPLLALAMSDTDGFPHAEERRLFYVALTRARRRAVIVTDEQALSPFVAELLRERRDSSQLTTSDLDPRLGSPCPLCNVGHLKVSMTSRQSRMLVCSARPSCSFTEYALENSLRQAAKRRQSHRRHSAGDACPTCATGKLRLIPAKPGKYRSFYGCTNYDFGHGCTFTSPVK